MAARQPALLRTAYLLTGDHHLAEDLLQTALMKTAQHWERIHTSPEAFVRRTLYHQNISWWRRRRFAETRLDGYDDASSPHDPSTTAAPKKQAGISFLLLDMRSEGVTVRPIHTLDGGAEVNDVFLDNVRVPADQLVGSPSGADGDGAGGTDAAVDDGPRTELAVSVPRPNCANFSTSKSLSIPTLIFASFAA
mgnify:CR=1 FL=1